MVRINLIKPAFLTDQHLVAEYNEILMLFGYVKKHPHTHFKQLSKIPKEYKLGEGHILFFKDKLIYLKKRHELIKKEMCKRGFRCSKVINSAEYDKKLMNDWKPSNLDKKIIKKRISDKINLKPTYYRYYREHKPRYFFVEMIKNAE
jgi:deoxyribonuclease (pyrimidine dimer)